jgi:hypothetical protein
VPQTDEPIASAASSAVAGEPSSRPALGVQGPVVAFHDPWAGDASDDIMRTGTGIPIAAQDPPLSPAQFVAVLGDLGAEFYVHHVVPTVVDHSGLLSDLTSAGIDVVLGNEYGNINGPFVEGTNRYDLPAKLVGEAATAGCLAGVLYDEPEHLQIHADQYRKDAHLPQFGQTEGLGTENAIAMIERTVRDIVDGVEHSAGIDLPVVSEQVFPVMFHTLARAGMTPCPKVMKESFQPLQLGAALGAALQYDRQLWICADLWGPDIGPWFTRAPGFPGHSPEEFASALRMAYFFAPDRLFVENIDVLVRHHGDGHIDDTEFGEVWREFVHGFVPAHPLRWSHREARADIALIYAEDSDFGRGARPFGNRAATAPATSRSVFEAWHLLSHGTIPAHGNSLHIPGYDFPRQRLDGVPRSSFPLEAPTTEPTLLHGLFQPMRSTIAFDERVTDAGLGEPTLIVAAGSRLPATTARLLRARAEAGATVVIAEWLAPPSWRASARVGTGSWVVTTELASDEDVHAAVGRHLGPQELWTQRFGATELRLAPGDDAGTTLEFEIAPRG